MAYIITDDDVKLIIIINIHFPSCSEGFKKIYYNEKLFFFLIIKLNYYIIQHKISTRII